MLTEAHRHEGNRKIINIYDNWSLDFNKSVYEQTERLQKDLIQISFIRGYMIDIGWYPEHDIAGKFRGVLVQYERWENPIYKIETDNIGEIADWIVEVTECVLDFDLKH